MTIVPALGRVMWMLNHETLRGAEVEFMRELGVEVFTPKVIPSSGFRSADVTYDYDDSLTIPERDLAVLNSFDFFGDSWTDEITRLANLHFKVIMVMPLGNALPQALEHFNGTIVLRVFGASAEMTYARVLTIHYGHEILDLIARRADDFVFGQAYANLSEVEPSFFKDRTITLPITLPRRPNLKLPPWTGARRRVATLCPDIADVFSARWYLRFLEEMGDLPHLILGNQDAYVRDPNVLGRVPWDQFGRELASSRVFFYMSREPRHVHYTPFEAAQIGQPVVFFDDSLFGDLCNGVAVGRVHSWREARELVGELVHSDAGDARQFHLEQHLMVSAMSWTSHLDDWRSAFQQLADWKQNKPSRRHGESALLEVLEYVKAKPAIEPPGTHGPRIQVLVLSACEEQFPDWAVSVIGLDEPESFGRWSTNDVVTLMLAAPVAGLVRLDVACMPFADLRGQEVTVRIGNACKSFFVPDEMSTSTVALKIDTPANEIDIVFPVTKERVGGQRRLGLAISRIKVTVGHDASAQRAGARDVSEATS